MPPRTLQLTIFLCKLHALLVVSGTKNLFCNTVLLPFFATSWLSFTPQVSTLQAETGPQTILINSSGTTHPQRNRKLQPSPWGTKPATTPSRDEGAPPPPSPLLPPEASENLGHAHGLKTAGSLHPQPRRTSTPERNQIGRASPLAPP